MARHDLDKLNEGLAERIDDMVELLFVNARRVGNYWELGDISGAPGSSLKIWRKGPKQGEWADFGAGTGGRPLGLAIAAKGDAGEGIRWAAAWLGHDATETPEERAAREARAARQREDKARQEAADGERLRRAAKGLFLSASPIAGTLADDYLKGRAIDIRRLPRQPGALRFHGAVKCPETGKLRPCLLAAVADADGFLSVHRHFLHRRPDGSVVKATLDPDAPMHDAKQSYSRVHGGCISIWRGDSGRPLRAMPAGEWITASEGIEDALSIAIAAPEMRVVAAIGLTHLGAMFIPKQCGGVIWHRHRGDGPQAIAQLNRQYDALNARGFEVREAFAPDGAKDFNEWLQREGARELVG